MKRKTLSKGFPKTPNKSKFNKPIIPNPADDVSFKQLEKRVRDYVYLSRGISRREHERKKLMEEINSESIRLKKNGYDLSRLDCKIIEGVEK